MNKMVKLLSSTVIVSTLVVGSSSAYITSNSQDVQAQSEQVQKWGHGEGGASLSAANMESDTELEAETPWYKYEGYTTYDPSFTQDYNFVRALKYDNVTMNGYKVDPEADSKVKYNETVYDTTVAFNKDDEAVQTTFFTKPDSVSKETFKDAHSSNQIIEEGKLGNDDGTFVEYKTNKGSYTAFFDHNDKLMEMTISQ
ncbi:MAG TPA: hypothetical protein VK115_03920 [Staphylococcus sp.]|nr:hypothetical protein [Staphylococcus sp.]